MGTPKNNIAHLHGLDWLVAWYAQHCDGEWEHGYGIKIYTVDNPGWTLHVDLHETHLEHVEIETVYLGDEDDPQCPEYRIEDGKFTAFGAENDLLLLINTFRQLWYSHMPHR